MGSVSRVPFHATDVRRLRGAPSVATGATPHMVHDTVCTGRG